MSRPKLSEGILVAIIVSLAVTVIFTVMSAFFPTRWLLQILIAAVSFSYIAYLLVRSTEKVGKLTVVVVWASVSILTWLFSPSIIVTLFVHVGLIWLVRALYFYTSLLVALLDLGLILFAMAAGIWTLSYTNSLFLGVWSFSTTGNPRKDPFEQAHQAAQTALRQLAAQR